MADSNSVSACGEIPKVPGGKVVQIAPGVWVDPARLAIPVERKYLLLDKRGYEEIGLTVKQQKTLSRLFEAGWIVLYVVTPRVWLLDLASWREHLKRVASDPWWWSDRRHLETYRGTYS